MFEMVVLINAFQIVMPEFPVALTAFCFYILHSVVAYKTAYDIDLLVYC